MTKEFYRDLCTVTLLAARPLAQFAQQEPTTVCAVAREALDTLCCQAGYYEMGRLNGPNFGTDFSGELRKCSAGFQQIFLNS